MGLNPGCERKNLLETDPSIIILGKGEIVEMGNYPNMEPVSSSSGYKEYLTDSVLKEYDYETGDCYYKKYWIDTLLHVEIDNINGPNLSFDYKYSFTDNNNKMRLEYTNMMAQFNSFIFKQIN